MFWFRKKWDDSALALALQRQFPNMLAMQSEHGIGLQAAHGITAFIKLDETRRSATMLCSMYLSPAAAASIALGVAEIIPLDVNLEHMFEPAVNQ